MRTPEQNAGRCVYDFDVCIGVEALKLTLSKLNSFRFELVAVTQTMDKYTVFFRRTLP